MKKKFDIVDFAVFEAMENIKRYDEGLIDSFMSVLKKVGEYFQGIGQDFLNALVNQTKGTLPKGVKIKATAQDLELLKRHGLQAKSPEAQAVQPQEAAHQQPEVQVEVPAEEETVPQPLAEAEVTLVHPNTKMRNVDLHQLVEEVEKAYIGASRGVTLMIWGAPGIGKTSIVGAVIKKYLGENAVEDRRLIDCAISQMLPEDFNLPYTVDDPDNKGSKFSDDAPKKWLPVYKVGDPDGEKRVNGPDGKGGILFLDELSRGLPPVRNLCLKLINERRIGQYVVGNKWAIIAASNRPDDDPDAGEMQGAITNRFATQINYVPDVDSWSSWALSAKDKDTGEMLVDPEIVAFLKFASKHFYVYDPSISKEIFPTPRTWQLATTNMRALRELRKQQGRNVSLEDLYNQTANAVGTDVATELVAFVKLMREVPLEGLDKVYTHPDQAPIPPRMTAGGNDQYNFKTDTAYAMISGVAFRKNGVHLTVTEVQSLMKYCQRLGEQWAQVLIKYIKDVHPYLFNMDPAVGKRTEEQKAFSLGMHDLVKKFPNLIKSVADIEK